MEGIDWAFAECPPEEGYQAISESPAEAKAKYTQAKAYAAFLKNASSHD